MKKRLFLLVPLAIILITAGCAPFITKPEKTVSPRAEELLDRINAINACMTASKGIGTISFQTRQAMPDMRFAWLCNLPDKIRLELLAPTGTPLLTLAADGDYCYFLPRTGQDRLRKKKATDINLERIISTPLTVSDAAHLLAGAIPLHEFDTAERIAMPDGDYILQLKRHWPGRTENIIFDKTTNRPRQIEFLRGSGQKLEYSVHFIGLQTINDVTIPESMFFRNSRDETAVITISRFWRQADVPIEKFRLTDKP